MKLEEYTPQNTPDESKEKEKSSFDREQSLREYENIERQSGESQAFYLQRAGTTVTKKLKEKFGMLFDPGRSKEEDLPQNIITLIEDISLEALKAKENSTSSFKNEGVIRDIAENVEYHNRGKLTDSDSFDTTQRNRKFFEIQPGKGAAKRETYWNTLFFPYDTKATRSFAKEILDDKTIVLLGGGRSQLKEELTENDITPREIINVDPFVENVEEGADRVVALSASDENFIDRMNEEGIVGADEIWAEYSVPAYLEDPREIQQLIQNIDALLTEGGTARIWPLEVGGNGEEGDRIFRKEALVTSIKEINATGTYEIILQKAAGRHGITLHKLAPSREELQKREDEEKIKEIRKQLGLIS
ncbi:MAG: hypothetical protein IPN70_01070 [Candidatus Moraniibacteriota bacterium]|nr:MAG: hypothetical protein IPN70_01070 [Candidatus Moranbacteria bacterium]